MTGPPAGPVGPETWSRTANPRALQQQRPLVYARGSLAPGLHNWCALRFCLGQQRRAVGVLAQARIDEGKNRRQRREHKRDTRRDAALDNGASRFHADDGMVQRPLDRDRRAQADELWLFGMTVMARSICSFLRSTVPSP